jgi:hypothetical protein
MEKRIATFRVHGRKIEGYPSMSYRVEFTTVDDLIKKIDEKIDETGYGKVDVYLEDEDQFKEEEVGKLEEEFIQMV